MNTLWLLLIIPVSVSVGLLLFGLLHAANDKED